MTDTQHLPLSVQPVISYPREALLGKTYLMTIDLQTFGDGEWHYEEEEYAIDCILDTSPVFSNKPVGKPAVVLHRFGGTYGPAKFLLTAAQEEIEGEIRVTLVNGWGVPVRVITLDNVKITQEVNSASRIIGHQREEFQQRWFDEENQAFADLDQRTVAPKENTFAAIRSFEASDDQFIPEQLIPSSYEPSLSLAIARLVNTDIDKFAIWVDNAPYLSGFALHEYVLPVELTQIWDEWQQMNACDRLDISLGAKPTVASLPLDLGSPASGQPTSYSSRIMQYLGISLWNWVFDGPIFKTFERSRSIAMGQHTRLRLRLDILDPHLIALPWEIMQREPGQSAMSLSQNVLFSRTISEVKPLPYLQTDQALNILLVLGENDQFQLEEEANVLERILTNSSLVGSNSWGYAPCMVNKLIRPTPQELISQLETKAYNVFFYASYGQPGPDGGSLFLRPGMTLSGIELAQVLTRTSVKLAVFNGCWGAQPAAVNHQAIPQSTLAEVLIRHGVPAVLVMRDQISYEESYSFIQPFAQALRARKPIDEAVAEARQQLLALYSFNQPAWTLPVLYMHPNYDGELIHDFDDGGESMEVCPIPTELTPPFASLRSLSPKGQTYSLRLRVTRIGRIADNDIVIFEPWVSRRHAEILCRNASVGAKKVQTYHIHDLSMYGTWVLESNSNGRHQIHRQEVTLESGMQLKFGSTKSQPWEFIIEE